MLIVRIVLTKFIILIIITNVFANDPPDSVGESASEKHLENLRNVLQAIHDDNETTIRQFRTCLANVPSPKIEKGPLLNDEAIANNVTDSGEYTYGKAVIQAEVHNLLRIHRNENVVPKSTLNTKSNNNKSTQTESLLDEPSKLPQTVIQQSYPVKGNYDATSSSYGNAGPDFNSKSNEDPRTQQIDIFINADSIYLCSNDYSIIQQITEKINTYNSNAVFVSAGNDISKHRLSLWHSMDLMQSRFINYPLYSDYHLNTYSASVGINEYIGNQMMIGLALSHFKLHHMLSNNNILTRSFNYVSLYGRYDFNNGISIQNIIGTTYPVINSYAYNLQNTDSIDWSHYYNNLKLNTQIHPFKNNCNILLIVSNDITFFYTRKANTQQDQSLDTSIKCSIGYIWPHNSIKRQKCIIYSVVIYGTITMLKLN